MINCLLSRYHCHLWRQQHGMLYLWCCQQQTWLLSIFSIFSIFTKVLRFKSLIMLVHQNWSTSRITPWPCIQNFPQICQNYCCHSNSNFTYFHCNPTMLWFTKLLKTKMEDYTLLFVLDYWLFIMCYFWKYIAANHHVQHVSTSIFIDWCKNFGNWRMIELQHLCHKITLICYWNFHGAKDI